MKAAVVKALGTPPVYADFPDPQDRDGAVVATVEAAALKNLDRVMVSGKHYSGAHLPLPMVAGVDGVARLDDGRLVYANARPPYGMMAEKTLINPAAAIEVPEGIDPVLAAAVPTPPCRCGCRSSTAPVSGRASMCSCSAPPGSPGPWPCNWPKPLSVPAGSLRLAATQLASNGCRKWAPTP